MICMEACDTSMEKFYASMHKLKETTHIDLLLKRMINHVREPSGTIDMLFRSLQIVDALQFLKSKGILHRDVKPSNILVKQNPVVFKICDFGISGQLTNSVAHTMMKGTQVYLAVRSIRSPQILSRLNSFSIARANRCNSSSGRIWHSIRYVGIGSFHSKLTARFFVRITDEPLYYLVGNRHWSTSVRKDERNRNNEYNHDMGTGSTGQYIRRIATTSRLAVSRVDVVSSQQFILETSRSLD